MAQKTADGRKYLIWDFDGTLGYRIGAWSGTLVDVLQRTMPHLRITPEEIRPYVLQGFPWHTPHRPHPKSQTADEWWSRLDPVFERAFAQGAGLDPARAKDLAKQVRQVYLDPRYWVLFDDAVPTLTELSSRGWRQVILSNHVPELGEILGFLGIDPYFEMLFNSAEMGYEKPHPQAFRSVLNSIGDCSSIWMIGDNIEADIRGAEQCGIPGILVRKGHPDAMICCEKLSEVVKVVSS